MPWAELLMGLALICGIWRRTAAALVGALLVVFIVAISVNLLRGNADRLRLLRRGTTRARASRSGLHDMRMVVVRDVGMLLLVAQGLCRRAPQREEDRAA